MSPSPFTGLAPNTSIIPRRNSRLSGDHSRRRQASTTCAYTPPLMLAEAPRDAFTAESGSYVRQGRFEGAHVEFNSLDGFPCDFVLPGPQLLCVAHSGLERVLDGAASACASSMRACSSRNSRHFAAMSFVLMCVPPHFGREPGGLARASVGRLIASRPGLTLRSCFSSRLLRPPCLSLVVIVFYYIYGNIFVDYFYLRE